MRQICETTDKNEPQNSLRLRGTAPSWTSYCWTALHSILLLLVAISLSSCATKTYVSEQIAQNEQHFAVRVGSLQADLESSHVEIEQLRAELHLLQANQAKLVDTTKPGMAYIDSTDWTEEIEPVQLSLSQPANFLELPPPQPTSSKNLGIGCLGSDVAAITYGNAADHIKVALDAAGYGQPVWFVVPGGFAVLSPVEQFDTNGSRVGQSQTSFQGVLEAPFSGSILNRYLSKVRFLLGSGHRFRCFLFLLTDSWSGGWSDESFSPELVDQLMAAGGMRLPETMRSSRVTEEHDLHVLVYEFVRANPRKVPRLSPYATISPTNHIKASGLSTTGGFLQ